MLLVVVKLEEVVVVDEHLRGWACFFLLDLFGGGLAMAILVERVLKLLVVPQLNEIIRKVVAQIKSVLDEGHLV